MSLPRKLALQLEARSPALKPHERGGREVGNDFVVGVGHVHLLPHLRNTKKKTQKGCSRESAAADGTSRARKQVECPVASMGRQVPAHSARLPICSATQPCRHGSAASGGAFDMQTPNKLQLHSRESGRGSCRSWTRQSPAPVPSASAAAPRGPAPAERQAGHAAWSEC